MSNLAKANEVVSQLAKINDMSELYSAVCRSGRPFKKTLQEVLLSQGLDKRAARELTNTTIESKKSETNSMLMGHLTDKIQAGWRIDCAKTSCAGKKQTVTLVAPPAEKVKKSAKVDLESVRAKAQEELLQTLRAAGVLSDEAYFNIVTSKAAKVA